MGPDTRLRLAIHTNTSHIGTSVRKVVPKQIAVVCVVLLVVRMCVCLCACECVILLSV